MINLVFRAGQKQAVYSIGQRPEMIAAEKVKNMLKQAAVICRTMARRS